MRVSPCIFQGVLLPLRSRWPRTSFRSVNCLSRDVCAARLGGGGASLHTRSVWLRQAPRPAVGLRPDGYALQTSCFVTFPTLGKQESTLCPCPRSFQPDARGRHVWRMSVGPSSSASRERIAGICSIGVDLLCRV